VCSPGVKITKIQIGQKSLGHLAFLDESTVTLTESIQVSKKIAGQVILSEETSREGTVYMTSSHVYKIFGKKANPYENHYVWKTVEAQGVPIADTAKFTAEFEVGGKKSTVQGIRSQRINWGRKFQFSKPGGEQILINEIGKANNPALLRLVLAGLENAVKSGLTDPQGFIDVHHNPPLCFIDIHSRGSETLLAFAGAINAAKVQLAELTGATQLR